MVSSEYTKPMFHPPIIFVYVVYFHICVKRMCYSIHSHVTEWNQIWRTVQNPFNHLSTFVFHLKRYLESFSQSYFNKLAYNMILLFILWIFRDIRVRIGPQYYWHVKVVQRKKAVLWMKLLKLISCVVAIRSILPPFAGNVDVPLRMK